MPVAAGVAGLVAALVACWLLLVPQGGQPDEHSHIVRSAALVRGAHSAPDVKDGYVLPDRYVVADPGCYAFQPTISARCVILPEASGGEVILVTRADDYPWGGHLLFGVAGLLPGLAPVWWGRLAAAAIGTARIAAALVFAWRSRSLSVGALLLGLTPMAWAIIPAVNPSSMVTAGGAALWVGLLLAGRHTSSTTGMTAGHRWLIALAWAATVLPRRDGMVWACLIAVVALLLTGSDLVGLGRRLGAGPVATIAASTAAVILWGFTSDARASSLVVLAPLVVVLVEGVRHWWARSRPDSVVIAWIAGLAVLVGVVAWVALISTRPDGWDTDLVVTVIGQTDENIIEAIGVLGWLDTRIPNLAVFAWLVLLGMLVAGAAVANRRGLVAAGAVALIAAVTAWTFELLQGDDSGTYWQGRYSLPLLVGVPLLIAWRPADPPTVPRSSPVMELPRFGTVAAVGGLVLLNVAAWSAARRWGVGTTGSYLPWRWDTAVQPFPVLVLLVVHAAATIALGWVLLRPTADPG